MSILTEDLEGELLSGIYPVDEWVPAYFQRATTEYVRHWLARHEGHDDKLEVIFDVTDVNQDASMGCMHYTIDINELFADLLHNSVNHRLYETVWCPADLDMIMLSIWRKVHHDFEPSRTLYRLTFAQGHQRELIKYKHI